MTNVMKTTTLTVVTLAAVASLSYGAGATPRKDPVNAPLAEMKWEDLIPGAPLKMAKLWGDRGKGGDYAMLLKLPAGFEAGMHAHSGDYFGITTQGTWIHTNEGGAAHELPPGSYVFQPAKLMHNDSCKGPVDRILFIHQHAKGDFIPAQAAAKK
jgi:hypothetical protein